MTHQSRHYITLHYVTLHYITVCYVMLRTGENALKARNSPKILYALQDKKLKKAFHQIKLHFSQEYIKGANLSLNTHQEKKKKKEEQSYKKRDRFLNVRPGIVYSISSNKKAKQRLKNESQKSRLLQMQKKKLKHKHKTKINCTLPHDHLRSEINIILHEYISLPMLCLRQFQEVVMNVH